MRKSDNIHIYIKEADYFRASPTTHMFRNNPNLLERDNDETKIAIDQRIVMQEMSIS